MASVPSLASVVSSMRAIPSASEAARSHSDACESLDALPGRLGLASDEKVTSFLAGLGLGWALEVRSIQVPRTPWPTTLLMCAVVYVHYQVMYMPICHSTSVT